MKKRTRVYLGCLAITLILFLVLGVVYACLVLFPTHYAEFERSQATLLNQVHEKINPKSATVPTPAAGKPDAGTVAAAATPTPLANWIDYAVRDERDPYGNSVAFMAALTRIGDTQISTDHLENIQWDYDRLYEFLGNIVGGYRTVGLGWNGDEAEFEKRAAGTVANYLDAEWYRLGRDMAGFKFKDPERFKKMVGDRLDGIEWFLTNVPYDKFPDFDEFNLSFITELTGFTNYVKLAAIRACEREDYGRATTILLNYMELYRRIHLGSFPMQGNLFNTFTSLNFLAQYPRFPDAELDRLRKKLDEMRLTPEEIERLRKAHAIRAGRQYKKMRAAMLDHTMQGTWHYLFNGAPERAANNLIAPVLDRQFETLVIAWTQGDKREIERIEGQVKSTARLMNLGDDPLHIYYHSVSGMDFSSFSSRVSKRFNDDIDRNILILDLLRAGKSLRSEITSSTVAQTQGASNILPSIENWRTLRIPLPAAKDKTTTATRPAEIFANYYLPENDAVVRGQCPEVYYPLYPPIPDPIRELVRN